MMQRILICLEVSFLITASFLVLTNVLYAQSVDELRGQISSKESAIEKLEEEIKGYEKDLMIIGREKQTLQSAVNEIDVSRRKTSATISLTGKQIDGTESTIRSLALDIAVKATTIDSNKQALAQVLRKVNESESDTFIETLLRNTNISYVWDDIENLQQFQREVRNKVRTLDEKKEALKIAQSKEEEEKRQLTEYKKKLAAEKTSLDISRNAKNELLSVTKNKESNYQALLEEKRLAKEKFEKELQEFESKLQYILDPSRIPPSGKGVLQWPLSDVHVTQYFGNTEFAKSGAYNGSGHNGIDFRAAIGTPVKTALAGTVVETGNTDAYAGCYSYGKWILIRHDNGLSTLYAHLSDVQVTDGELVATGDIIGYSGNTGYSTGPHLHFTVYASEAVKVVRLGEVKSRTNCAQARIPVAALNAYFNPLDYL